LSVKCFSDETTVFAPATWVIVFGGKEPVFVRYSD
jgi:hypothetical protein